jgi:hypothetical protein
MRTRYAWRALLIVSLVAVAALLPGAGQSRPPESDGSTYTWTGAATLTVDVKPWGGGYVRSDPYLIDCPMACTRAFEPNREVKLTATMTPGHTFKAWEGACAGQGNPCTIKVSGSMDVVAVLEGRFVPPAPVTPVAVNPALSVDVSEGDCDEICFHMGFSGTGFHPNSKIDITFAYVTPDFGTFVADDARTSDAGGNWSATFGEDCNLPDRYTGPVVIAVTATDADGASASTQVNGICPAPPPATTSG